MKYWLYEIPSGDLFNENVKYVVYDDAVPNTGVQYMSGVPKECKTVPEAMAWKFSDDEHTLYPEHWENLKIGIHMN